MIHYATSTAYEPSEPPRWFLGNANTWNLARELFVQSQRLNRQGAQHLLLGLGLILGSAVLHGTMVLGHAAEWATGIAGILAVAYGHHRRRQAQQRSTLSIESIMIQCNNPTMGAWADAQSKAVLVDAVHGERLDSPKGSFDELMSAVAEACLTGRSVRAPMHWWHGQRFVGFVEGPSFGTTVAPPRDQDHG